MIKYIPKYNYYIMINLYTAISYKTTYKFQVIDNLYIDMIK